MTEKATVQIDDLVAMTESAAMDAAIIAHLRNRNLILAQRLREAESQIASMSAPADGAPAKPTAKPTIKG